jgi:hypothetical protein
MSEPRENTKLFDFIRKKCIERYGAPFVHDDEDGKAAFSMWWFPKRGGRQAIVNVQEEDTNGLRVEFTRSAAEGMCKGVVGRDDCIDVFLWHKMPNLRFARTPGSILFGTTFRLNKEYHTGLDTKVMVLDLIWSLMMA